MKRAFTLIEIIIVIIILGIIGTITTKILIKVYKQYYYARALNRLSYETDAVLNIIAVKLRERVRNSAIGVECNASVRYSSGDLKSDCRFENNRSATPEFLPLSSIPEDEREKYPVLEWIAKAPYAKRGIWYEDVKMAVPGTSGFVDLVDTQSNSDDNYTIYSQDTNLDVVRMVENNWTQMWGINGDVFDFNYTALIFAGSDDRGAFNDINHSYGYYKSASNDNKAEKVFKIYTYTVSGKAADGDLKTTLDIKAVDTSNDTDVYEKYYLVKGAYAIVPVCNAKDKNCSNGDDDDDYNLTLYFNYYPWNKQKYFNLKGDDVNGRDANKTLIATHVTQFRFREEGGVVRVYICIQDPKIKVGGEPVSICKQKVVF